MKKRSFFISMAIIGAFTLITSSIAYAQTLSSIMSNTHQFDTMIPGVVACKTRTNNEATVRNLAHGVWNRDSNELVALNCGWSAPGPWSRNSFTDSARLDGSIYTAFQKAAGVSYTVANSASCAISVSTENDPTQNPQSSGVLLGTNRPSFTDTSSAQLSFPSVKTSGITYPSSIVFFSAFCRIPKGVRLQLVVLRADSVGTW